MTSLQYISVSKTDLADIELGRSFNLHPSGKIEGVRYIFSAASVAVTALGLLLA
jgi:hypothetical protein